MEQTLNPLTQSKHKQLDSLFSEAESMTEPSSRDEIVGQIFRASKSICDEVVHYQDRQKLHRSEKLDHILTSRTWGFPIMLAMLGVIIWLTIAGANVPSSMLAETFGWLEGYITLGFQAIHAPDWLHGLLVLGLYRGISWVVSVMLPPMAIFFPAFALLENFGYLPRVAFNMDRLFKRSGGHGKQSLTMAMGFGCNAAAIMSTRIIESPRERMLAILTNNFVPCNGRWPTLILLSSLFMAAGVASGLQTFATAAIVMGMVLFGVVITLLVSWILSKTALKGSLPITPWNCPPIGDPSSGTQSFEPLWINLCSP